jgi:hypothetical protein
LVCDAKIRFVEHKASEGDITCRSELAGKTDVIG